MVVLAAAVPKPLFVSLIVDGTTPPLYVISVPIPLFAIKYPPLSVVKVSMPFDEKIKSLEVPVENPLLL